MDVIKLIGKKYWAPQILRYLWQLKKNLAMGQDKLREFQDDKLRKIVTHAYDTVPFYKNLFNKHKINPNDIRTVSDLNYLPVINKDLLQEIPFDQKVSLLYLDKPLVKLYTAGSTGKSFTLYISEEGEKRRIANSYRIFFLHGYSLFDKKAMVVGLTEDEERRRWRNRVGLQRDAVVSLEWPLDEQVKFLVKYEPNIIEAYPSRLNSIAQFISDRHVKIKRPKIIITNSETLLPAVRSRIEESFGAKVTCVYDSWEFGQMAWECPKHNGLHINADSLVMQIVRDRQELNNGQSGEIVLTDLDNYAMPLIRYNIKDRGAKLTRKCNCGIAFPILKSISGRNNDFVFSPTGEELSPLVINNTVIELHQGIVEYQIIQDSIEGLTIDMVVANDYNYDTDKKIRQQLTDLFKFSKIVINHPACIKRTDSGKLRTVICNLKNSAG